MPGVLTTLAIVLSASWPETAGVQAAAPAAGPATEAAVHAGGLALERRIVRGVDVAGESVAGYLQVRNSGASADELTGVSCTCAARVELHRIHREDGRVEMVTDASWPVSAGEGLTVRPGSPLHLMLIDYDPAAATDGKVTLRLQFRDAGEVAAEFRLVEDTGAGWAAFD